MEMSQERSADYVSNKNLKFIGKRLGSWITAGLILGYLFWRIDIGSFAESLKLAGMAVYLPLVVGFIFLWLLIESHNIMMLCHHLGHRITFKQVLEIRGVTYLLMLINPFLGLGGIAYYLSKDIDIPLVRTSSLMIFYSYTEMISLTCLVTIGSIFLTYRSLFFTQMYYLSISAIIFYICMGIIGRKLPATGHFKKITDAPIWKTFYDARVSSFFILPLWRSVYFISFILFFYFGLKAFSITIPLARLFVYVPLIFWVSCWPITPSGLGTIQASMLFLFKEYSSEANILAFSITYSTSLLILRIPIGLYYLKKRHHSYCRRKG
ncbi:MAG: flippase-like domain-containing protein [Proteobacteria bacterium]|nr:flippase-like domain-containing protein [Pseudomonadota bacterium]